MGWDRLTDMSTMCCRYGFTLASILFFGSSLGALASDVYSSRSVKILVGYSAGGAVDVIARLVGQIIFVVLGQPFIVEYKPGAGTNIAIQSLISSPPNGYTLLLAANALAVTPRCTNLLLTAVSATSLPLPWLGAYQWYSSRASARTSRRCQTW